MTMLCNSMRWETLGTSALTTSTAGPVWTMRANAPVMSLPGSTS